MPPKLKIPGKYGFLCVMFIACINNAISQKKTYKDSILAHQQNYISTHEVVGEADRKYIQFYGIDQSYRVTASFIRIADTKGFEMNTSAGGTQQYFLYGRLTFRLQGRPMHLSVYQSASLMKQEKYKAYLFVPFTDATSGFESYGGGRYLEFYMGDIKNNKVVLDFNKAYNPYCAYTSGYNCPVPPKENLVNFPVTAGEKNYGKPVH